MSFPVADIVSAAIGIAAWVGGKFNALETQKFTTAVEMCEKYNHCDPYDTYYPIKVKITKTKSPEDSTNVSPQP